MFSVSGPPDSGAGDRPDDLNAGGQAPGMPGAELADLTQRRLLRDAIVANGLGGLLVLILGVLAPGAPDPDAAVRLGVLNAAAFVVFSAIVDFLYAYLDPRIRPT